MSTNKVTISGKKTGSTGYDEIDVLFDKSNRVIVRAEGMLVYTSITINPKSAHVALSAIISQIILYEMLDGTYLNSVLVGLDIT